MFTHSCLLNINILAFTFTFFRLKMVRTYQRKTNRLPIDQHEMKTAVEEVKSGKSLRKVAVAHNINFKTLANYCKKLKLAEVAAEVAVKVPPRPDEVDEELGPNALTISDVSGQLGANPWARFGYAKARSVSYTLLATAT